MPPKINVVTILYLFPFSHTSIALLQIETKSILQATKSTYPVKQKSLHEQNVQGVINPVAPKL